MVTHQQNHVRLQRLRHLSSLLDSELTSLLTTLSNTRGEIINVPSTRFEKGTYRKVDYASLLAYATKISRYTRVAAAAVPDDEDGNNASAGGEAGGGAGGAEGDGAGSGGATAPGGAGGDNKLDAKDDKNAGASATGGGGTAGSAQQKQKGKDGKDDAKNGNAADTAEQAAAQANKAGGDKNRLGLTHEESALVDPSSGMPFAPWPSEQIIQRGLLARMDYEGITAQEFIERQEKELLAKQQAEAGIPEGLEGHRIETLEKAQVQGMDREKAAEAARAREEKKAAVFTGLDLYDPDAED